MVVVAIAALSAPASAEPAAEPAKEPGPSAASRSTAQPAGIAPADDSPGFFDVRGRVRAAVDDWFRSLVIDALNPTLELLGRTVLATPDFTGPGRVRDLWVGSWAIANTGFVLFIVAAGVIAMSHETLQTRTTLKELLPRLVVAWVAANASLLVAGKAIELANALSGTFAGQGLGSAAGAGGVVAAIVTSALAGGGIFVVLVGLVVVVLALGLLGTYVVRVATLVVLVGAAPLFLVAHALPATEGAARMWWRALAGCLAVQVGQAFVLITAVRVFFDADGRRTMGLPGGPLADLVVVACLLWMMLRIPSYARRLVFQTRPNVGSQVARHVVVNRGARAITSAAKAAAA
jgi:hypothetical protein